MDRGVLKCCAEQFIGWKDKDSVVAWLDDYLVRITDAFGIGRPSLPPLSPSLRSNSPPSSGLPWAALTTRELLRVFASESWDGQLDVNEFGRVLQKLLGMDRASASALAGQLFPCFDRDGNGLLDFREVFIGMAILCGGTRQERLEAAFSIMDADGSGRVSRTELKQFLCAVAPRRTSMAEINMMLSIIMREADTNFSGFITFQEVCIG